jgi:hypothetical protein
MTGGDESDFRSGYAARTVIDGVEHTYGEGNNGWQAIPGQGIVGDWLWQNEAEKNIAESKSGCDC